MSDLNLIADAIRDYLGERCSDFDPGCLCCRAWAEYDEITALRAENERLRAAIAWIDAPFVDDSTPEAELRQRVTFCVADASRAMAGRLLGLATHIEQELNNGNHERD